MDLNVIDCSKNHEKKMLRTLVLYDKMLGREDGIWMAIDQAFAEPVTRTKKVVNTYQRRLLLNCSRVRGIAVFCIRAFYLRMVTILRYLTWKMLLWSIAPYILPLR